MTTARTHTLRYRIWAYATPRGWDATIAEIADALGEGVDRIRATIQHAGWASRVRVSSHDVYGNGVPGSRSYAQNLAAQIVAGRVEVTA